MQINLKKNPFFLLLQISIVTVFLGRAYQYFFWDVPFRSLLWDESLLRPIIESLGLTWASYASSSELNSTIKFLSVFFGVLFVLAAIFVLRYNWKSKLQHFVLLTASLGLVLLAVLLLKSQFYRLGQFFEYSIQFGIPFIFIYYNRSFVKRHLIFLLKLCIAFTFTAHGLYAVGFYPVPGHFLAMVIDILGLSEGNARLFLTIAGCLDFLVAVGLFVPKITRLALVYAFVWGTLTALVRIIAGFDFSFFIEMLHLNMYQVVYRLAHGLIPLAVLIKLKEEDKT